MQDGIDWKQRFEALVDKIEDVEERMTKVVYKLKSESLESEFLTQFCVPFFFIHRILFGPVPSQTSKMPRIGKTNSSRSRKRSHATSKKGGASLLFMEEMERKNGDNLKLHSKPQSRHTRGLWATTTTLLTCPLR